MNHLIAAIALLSLAGCVSAPSNLARLQAECAIAPLAEIGNLFIPYVGGALNYTIGAVCANPQLIADDEAKIAAAIQAINQRRAK